MVKTQIAMCPWANCHDPEPRFPFVFNEANNSPPDQIDGNSKREIQNVNF